MSIASKAVRLLGLALFAMLLGARAYAADPVFVVVGSCSTLFNCYPAYIVLKQPSAVADTDKLLVCNRQEATGKGNMGLCGYAGQVSIKAKSAITSSSLIGVCFGGSSSSTPDSCNEDDHTPADQEGWNLASAVFGTTPGTQPQPPTDPVFSGEALLNWTPPFMNTDGSALTNLAGFRVYYGTSVSALNQTVQIPGATTSYYSITGLSAGTWYFAVSAYASNGAESNRSAIAMKSISAGGAAPPVTPPPAENGQLCLVDGDPTGGRAVYASTASGRGAQVGTLSVGPVSQPVGTVSPVTRARCSCVDIKNWSGVVYSKVASPAGYVSSCKNYGTP